MRSWTVVGLLALALALGCSGGDTPSNGGTDNTGTEKKIKLAMIPKGTMHEFWKTVEAGARRAADEMNVELTWKGPIKEDDKNQQIQVVNDFVGNVDAIALAPLDSKGLRGPVKAANDAKTPVIIFDSAIEDSDIVSFVATDNHAAGMKAGEAMAKALGGKGKVVVLRYLEGSASTTQREDGFIMAAKAGGLEIASSDQHAGASPEEARQAAGRLIQRFSSGGKMTIDGIFAPNESSAFGTLLALQESGMAGKVLFYGFDSSEKLLEGLRKGEITGLILQDPFNMGYLTVKTIVAHLKGEKVEPMTDTGSTLVTKENIDSDQVKKLLNPLG